MDAFSRKNIAFIRNVSYTLTRIDDVNISQVSAGIVMLNLSIAVNYFLNALRRFIKGDVKAYNFSWILAIGVGQNEIIEWDKKYKETDDLSNKSLNISFKKIAPEKLKAYMAEHPDAKFPGYLDALLQQSGT